MAEKNKKSNFFKEAFKSIKDLDKYEDFALETPKVSFKYFIKLILVFVVIISFFYTLKIVDNCKNVYSTMKEKLPEFSYSNGTLNMETEEPIIIDDYSETFGKILIDTNSTELTEYQDRIQKENISLVVLKNKCVVISNSTLGQVEYNYLALASSCNINEFTKQSAIEYFESLNIVSMCASLYFIIFIYLFIVYFISIFMDILILWVLTYLVSKLSKLNLKAAPSFGVAVHAITLSLVLYIAYIILNLLTGINVKYFGLMYNLISYIYVIVAVLMIKTDFINRQIELMKLANEQEKVKAELEKEKEKKDQEEKENKPEKKEKKKGKKEKEKDEGQIDGTVNPSTIQVSK